MAVVRRWPLPSQAPMCLIRSWSPRPWMLSLLSAPSPRLKSRKISVSIRATPAGQLMTQGRQRGYTPHVPRKVNEPAKPKHRRGKARRWKVERTHSWLNRARRLLIRWEKKVANYFGFLHLQFAIVALRTAGVLG